MSTPPTSNSPSGHAGGRPPSVDAIARALADVGLPHPLLVDAARAAIAAGDPPSARERAEAVAAALLRPVVNATGVILHTNLGRAPLPLSPLGATGGARRYSNLEFDLVGGRRASRSDHAASLLARAVGAEAALVVNNGAGALLLVLAALARGRSVVVSRGELVEIGGGFRVPEVMSQSGATLVEVGTTNRTRVADYRAAVTDRPGADGIAMLLKVHQSNYRMVGFTEAVEVARLSGLGPPVVADIGSGLLDATTPWLSAGPPAWLAGEPAARQTLAAGAALVTFSGDKLMGGPQAGIIAGRRDLVAICARHPLNRALRPGGLVLAALQNTALAYLRRDGDAIPFWRMAAAPVEGLRARAGALGVGKVVDTVAVAGGGSVPGQEVPSAGVAVDGDHAAALRASDPPIVARVHEGLTVCDLRTVDPADDAVLAAALRALPSSSQTGDAERRTAPSTVTGSPPGPPG
ncbi:MAG: L-seryl-tRNA(Sec) selenium transferase [Actinomycetota bacterium]|nr:L-seryl-tRNA(Sec) selenium transferase [Actinomycetota bacterium]